MLSLSALKKLEKFSLIFNLDTEDDIKSNPESEDALNAPEGPFE